MRVARHAYITQNNKVAIFLQYIQKEVSDEINFLHVTSQSSQNIKFAMSLQYL